MGSLASNIDDHKHFYELFNYGLLLIKVREENNHSVFCRFRRKGTKKLGSGKHSSISYYIDHFDIVYLPLQAFREEDNHDKVFAPKLGDIIFSPNGDHKKLKNKIILHNGDFLINIFDKNVTDKQRLKVLNKKG